MKFIKQALIGLLILLFYGTSWGETDKQIPLDVVKKMNQNHTVHLLQKDADMFLYMLNQLNESNEVSVRNFMEYMLDVIVCESWQNKDKLDSKQLEQTMVTLYAIKSYKMQNPAMNEERQIDPREVSALLPQFDSTYAEKSKTILAGL